jgi:S1-C subfamily serine protease/photosystem II stability/assembly factor-like uncharacterized protein
MTSTQLNRRQYVTPVCSLVLSAAMFLSAIGTSHAGTSFVPDEKVASDRQETDKAKAEKAKRQQRKKKKKTDNSTDRRLKAIETTLKALAQEVKALGQERTAAAKVQSAQKAKAKAEATKTRDQGKSKDALPVSLKLEPTWLENVKWRSIGPAGMSGRITDVAVHEQDSSVWWIATAGGGLLKTTNQGVTVEHQFDREKVVSIGCVATDPKNEDVVWVGTGEINPRNSVSYGNGVYKSVDGGKTFEHKGLDNSFQIARILVDPHNSDTVYVGAAGRLYGTNSERGVFKTTNGGESWEQVLYVDDQTGVIEMIMNPEDSSTIIVAMWDRLRDGFDSWPGDVPKPDGINGYDPIRKWGAGGGLYKTTDGGENWDKLTEGLPSGKTGRIGLDWQTKSPHTIFAIIDCEEIGKGPKPFEAFLGIVGTDRDGSPTVTQLLPKCPAEEAGVRVGDVLKTADGKDITEFDQLLDVLREKKIEDKLTLTLSREDAEVSVETTLTARPSVSQQRAPTIWLGAFGEDQEGGIVLKRVADGGPADKAGLREGDVVSQVDGKKVSGFRKLMEDLQDKSSGDKIMVAVVRGKKRLKKTLTLESRSSGGQQSPPRSNAFMGIQGENAEKGGAVLTTITDGGPSEEAGLKSGDVVRKIDAKDVADYEALVAEIRSRKPGDTMKLTVRRGKKNLNLEVTLGDRTGGESKTRPYTYSYFGQTPNVQDQQGAMGHEYGGVYKSTDSGDTWQRVNSLNTRPMYFSVIKVDPSDDQRVYVLGVSQFQSKDGGTTFASDFGRRVHADGHDLWIDPNDGRHMVIGCDGGFYTTYDHGANWDHINTAAIGQFYHVTISPRQPYWVAGGLQDNGSWSGPAISRNGGAINEDWINVGGGDGFVCRVDPHDPDLVYTESQNGSISRRHLVTGERSSIRPPRVDGVSYRFNWKTPFILSSHNSKIFYSAGNYVFRSLDRGNDLRAISPEITLTKRGSATALAESPRNPDVLYVGTDDGALWVTQDGGHNWKNITKNLGISDPRWVSTLDASRYEDGRIYVCLDAHRSDDDKPYAFVSEDFGATFKPLHEDLPWGSTRVLREDITNQNLLYLGTEFAMWVSLDRGQNWVQFNQNLPTVAIHEVAQNPATGEIVVATHGRSLWACDVTGLRQLKSDHISKDIAFHSPEDVIRWRREPRRGGTNRRYVSDNPSSGAQLWYSLPEKADNVVVRIENIEGELVSELKGKNEAGLHLVTWNLTKSVQRNQPARQDTTSAGEGEKQAKADAKESDKPKDSKPKTGKPKTDKPKADKPKADKPKADKPKADKPKTDKPKADKPKTDKPKTDKPKTDKPKTDKPKTSSVARTAARRPSSGGGQSRSGFRGARPVANGTYRVVLVVDGKELPARTISVARDPNVAADAVADEEYELRLLLDQQAAEDKFQAKAAGRQVRDDD